VKQSFRALALSCLGFVLASCQVDNSVVAPEPAARVVATDKTPPAIKRRAGTATTTVGYSTSSTTIGWNVQDAASGVASVTINGAAVSSKDTVYSIAATLVVGANRFILVATDSSKNAIADTVTITRAADVTAPTVVRMAPVSNAVSVGYSTTSYTLQWKVRDYESGLATVTVNGAAQTSSDSIYTVTSALAVGSNTYILKATDKVGKSRQDTVYVTRNADVTAPTVVRMAPVSNAVSVGYSTTSYTLQWKVRDYESGLATVTLNGSASTSSDSIYTVASNLAVGNNTYILKATDKVGKSRQDTVYVTRTADVTAPTIVRKSPTSNTVSVGYTTTSYTLQWKVRDYESGLATVTLNGSAMTSSDSIYTVASNLAVGNNTYILKATDKVGKSRQDTVYVTRTPDVTAPTVMRLGMASTQTVANSVTSFTAKWSVRDNESGVSTVAINGATVTSSDTTYSSTFSLAVGQNSYFVKATDKAGNSRWDTVYVTRLAESIPPTTVRSSGTTTRSIVWDSAYTYVSWTVTDNVGVASVTINGVAVTGTSNVYSSKVALAVGPNTIKIRALDAAGNSSIDSVVITRQADKVAPIVTRSTGASSRTVDWATTSTSVAWTVTDNDALASVKINGAMVTGSASVYASTIALSNVNTTVSIVATDRSGNSRIDSVVLTRVLPDRDGNRYRIGKMPDGRVWMRQNLITKPLTDVGSGYNCAYDSCATWGALYTWAQTMALADTCNDLVCNVPDSASHQGICPAGWHVPTGTEWKTLIAAAAAGAGDSVGASRLRSTAAVAAWRSSTGGVKDFSGTDAFGFTMLPTNSYSGMGGGGNYAGFWLAGAGKTASSGASQTFYSTPGTGLTTAKFTGFGVRCIAN